MYKFFSGGKLQEKMVKGVICAALFCFGSAVSQFDHSRQFFVASKLSVTLQKSPGTFYL